MYGCTARRSYPGTFPCPWYEAEDPRSNLTVSCKKNQVRRYFLPHEKVIVVEKTHVAPEPFVPKLVPVQWLSMAVEVAVAKMLEPEAPPVPSVEPAVIVPRPVAQHHSTQLLF